MMDLGELTLTKNDRFRWVKCQLDVLSKARTTKAVYDALDTLPIGLDETYERILANIDDDDFELVSTALKWITCSIRPLNIDELVEAIAVAPGQRKMDEEMRLSDPGDISDICGNLVDSTSKTIRLAHYSVKEFLTSKRLLTKPSRISRYAITIVSSHRELGIICLTYLSFEDFDSGPCRNPETLRVRLKTYPLLDYAARYWGQHSALGDIELEGHWLNELFSRPGNGMLLNLLEVTCIKIGKVHRLGMRGVTMMARTKASFASQSDLGLRFLLKSCLMEVQMLMLKVDDTATSYSSPRTGTMLRWLSYCWKKEQELMLPEDTLEMHCKQPQSVAI